MQMAAVHRGHVLQSVVVLPHHPRLYIWDTRDLRLRALCAASVKVAAASMSACEDILTSIYGAVRSKECRVVYRCEDDLRITRDCSLVTMRSDDIFRLPPLRCKITR